MQRSEEQFVTLDSGIELCYDTFGDPDDPALLLIMGLAGPLNWWAPDFCEQFAERGFYVIRFDNRDVGRSTKLRGQGGHRRDVVRGFARRQAQAAYTLSDMADDAVGLLDHLGIEKAHVTGVSMGGMIAQTLAIEHRDRVLSLVSIMSTTGRRSVGWQDPRLFPVLARPRRAHPRAGHRALGEDLEDDRLAGLPDSPGGDPRARGRDLRPRHQPVRRRAPDAGRAGPARPLQGAGHRSDIPALVIHGLSDKLVHVSGGRATARAIPGAELVLIPGMGHDMPRELWPVLVDGSRPRHSAAADSRLRPSGGLGASPPQSDESRAASQQLVESVAQVADQVPHVGHHLAAGDQAEVELAVVGEQRDVEAPVRSVMADAG